MENMEYNKYNKKRKNYMLNEEAEQKLEQLQGSCFLNKSQIVTLAIMQLSEKKLRKLLNY